MAKQVEGTFLERVDRDLKRVFGTDIMVENIQQASKSGTADRFICLKGQFVALEGKTVEGKASAIQITKLARIKRAGGEAFIIDPNNWSKVLHYLRKAYG